MFSLLVALALYLATTPAEAAASFVGPQSFLAAPAHLSLSAARKPDPPGTAAGPVKKDQRRLGIEVQAGAAAVMDWSSGVWLFEKDSEAAVSIASLTKLMTALVFLDEDVDWDRRIEIFDADIRLGRGEYLFVGETVTIRELFNVALVASSNEAAAALARSTGLSDREFAARMNLRAQEIGMTSAQFVEPTGLDPANQASARDVALLVKEALSAAPIADSVVLKEYAYFPREGQRRFARSTDLLLDSFLNKAPYHFLGGKTGYLDEAGYCFGAATADSSGNKVVAVILGAETKEERFGLVKKLIYWTFDVFEWPAAGPVR